MAIRVYFAFEGTATALYIVFFITCGFCVVKSQSLTTLSAGKINSVGSFPKHTRQNPNIAVNRTKMAYLAMSLVQCPPESIRLLIKVRN